MPALQPSFVPVPVGAHAKGQWVPGQAGGGVDASPRCGVCTCCSECDVCVHSLQLRRVFGGQRFRILRTRLVRAIAWSSSGSQVVSTGGSSSVGACSSSQPWCAPANR